MISAWKHSLETVDPFDVDHRLRRADGVYRWFHARGLPLRDAEGRVDIDRLQSGHFDVHGHLVVAVLARLVARRPGALLRPAHAQQPAGRCTVARALTEGE